MQTPFEYVGKSDKTPGLAWSALLSLIFHAGLITYMILSYVPPASVQEPPPRFVEFIQPSRQPQRTFEEAPGPEAAQRAADAAFSNRNRKASTPRPTGEERVRRPGEGGMFNPSAAGGEPFRAPQTAQAPAGAAPNPSRSQASPRQNDDSFAYRVTTSGRPQNAQATMAAVDWKSAIQEVGKVASIDAARQQMGSPGGEPGFAESGPISFETQWYDWGEYAESMVRRIRVNWYANMPELIRLGIKGVVTIRFTIQRSGAITDVTLLESSGTPPYDYAAKKAIELSSPLAPLPADFPNSRERVTAMFYYNSMPAASR